MTTNPIVLHTASLDCIHCGLCLQTCPTFRLTGSESASPRGRIHLMRAVAEERLEPDAAFADEMDACLLCRHCESVCPAGVRFGEMMEFTRDALEKEQPRSFLARTARRIAFRHLLPNRIALRLAGSLLRLAQLFGLDRLAPLLLGKLGAGARETPRVAPLSARRLLPETIPAKRSRADAEDDELLFLEGCVMPEFYPQVNRATVTSLAALGATVHVLSNVVCCGSLHAHNGDGEGARKLVQQMIRSWEAAGRKPLVTNSAGCGAHMRDCAHLFEEGSEWRTRAEAFNAAVLDYTEAVAARLSREGGELVGPELDGPLTWDDPCHLCHGQGIRAEPRRILDAISGIERVELPDSESCCGSAGIYSLLRPDDAGEIFARKLEALKRTNARLVVTANPGCHMQWSAGLARANSDVRVAHLAELVAASTRATTHETT